MKKSDNTSQTGQLWNKGQAVDEALIRYTVGTDYLHDQRMVKHDILGSIAQAKMLKKIGILTEAELKKVIKAFKVLLQEWEAGKFVVKQSEEDCHTAIEAFLVKQLGDLGKKIHTARSRNDQVVTMTRLYTKDRLQGLYAQTLLVVDELLKQASKGTSLPLPGYTHMQRAMPASVAMWYQQFAEALLDDLRLLKAAYEYNNMSPLGSAAGFGVHIPIDREYTAKLLGFAKVQNSPMYVSYTRGKIEASILFALNQLIGTFAKFSNDVLLFSMSEFQFLNLPAKYCTGSSLMPQKRNGDVFELTRGKANMSLGYVVSAVEMQNTLLSGYNRDTQLTKELLLQGLDLYADVVTIMEAVIPEITFNKDKCVAACTAELYATDEALDLVLGGMPFRDAYKQVGLNLEQVKQVNPVASLKKRVSLGAAGNLNTNVVKQDLAGQRKWVAQEQKHWQKIESALMA